MKRSVKKPETQQKTEINKSDYWLNVQLPTGQIGINLAHGIEQHDVVLGLIEKLGVEDLNEYYKSENANCYVVQVGHKAENRIDDLASKIKAKLGK